MPTSQKRRPTFSERVLLRLSTSRFVDGFWIGTLPTGLDPGITNRRVEEALESIRAYDPSRYERLRRYLPRIWVRVQGGGNTGCYNAALDACELDPRHLLRADVTPSDIASIIVHEATHAKLTRCGIVSSESLRSRVEDACRKQERAFSERLPLPQGDKIRDKLRRIDQVPEDFWSDASSAQRDQAGVDEALVYLGVPRWFLPVSRLTRAVVGLIRRLIRSISRLRAA